MTIIPFGLTPQFRTRNYSSDTLQESNFFGRGSFGIVSLLSNEIGDHKADSETVFQFSLSCFYLP